MTLRTIYTALGLTVAAMMPAQRIAVLTDIHVGPGSANEAQLRIAVDEINRTDLDAVIVSGDLANEGSDAELLNVKGILDGIRHPLYVLPGNHEDTWSQSATKTFVDLWGNDRFVADMDSLVIVGINCGPYMKMGDGHIKQEDLHWLRATLDKATADGRKRVLSVNHYPLLDDLDNYREYIRLLEDYPVIGHINGHYHRYNFYRAGGPDSGSTLPCITARALDVDKHYGYTIFDIDSDWVHIYHKPIGESPEPQYAFATKTKHKKARFAAADTLTVPEGFKVEKVWADSASVFTRLAFDGNNIYFGNSLGQTRAIDRTGQLRWSVPTGASLFSRATVLNDKQVAIPMHDGILLLDPATGKRRGKIASTEGPYVADGTLTPDGSGYIQGGYKRIERHNPRNGRKVWVYDSIFNYCQAAPAIDGDDLIFGAWDTNLRCLDLKTGRLKWVWNNGKSANMLGPGNVVPVITPDRVYVVAPDRYMTAIDRRTGATIWRDNSHKYRESLGRSEDGTRVYAKTMDGELVAIDATVPHFNELWLTDLTLGYEHAPCVIVERDGYVYTGSRRGKVTISKADGSGLVAALPLGVSEINGIDVDPVTGDIYVSLIEGTIYRIAKEQTR